MSDSSRASIIASAITKRDEIKEEFESIGVGTNPLCLIQIENERDRSEGAVKPLAETIMDILIDEGVDESKIAIWVSKPSECRNLENITSHDNPVEYLIFKQAIATGWDCPRAHVLVKLRETKSAVFDTQTIGRTLRTVEQKHYGSDNLDNSFIFTQFGELEYKLDVNEDMRNRIITPNSVGHIKPEITNFYLPKTEKEFQLNVNSSTLQSLFMGQLSALVPTLTIKESELKDNLIGGVINTSDIYSEGRATRGLEGNIVDISIEEMELEMAKVFKKINKFNDSMDVIPFVKRTILRHPQAQSSDMSSEEFVYKLFFSNKEVFSEISTNVINNYTESFGELLETTSNWVIPETVIYPNSTREHYSKYTHTITPNLSTYLTRSSSEKPFIDFLESSDKVKWMFKNGDSGSENFSIPYTYYEEGDSFATHKNYYPDFLFETVDGHLFIVDTKARFGNNDFPQVNEKYLAGKQFENSHTQLVKEQGFSDLTVSMIKFDKVGNSPYILTSTNYYENKEQGWVELDTLL